MHYWHLGTVFLLCCVFICYACFASSIHGIRIDAGRGELHSKTGLVYGLGWEVGERLVPDRWREARL